VLRVEVGELGVHQVKKMRGMDGQARMCKGLCPREEILHTDIAYIVLYHRHIKNRERGGVVTARYGGSFVHTEDATE